MQKGKIESEIGQPFLRQRQNFLVSQLAVPQSLYEYSCPERVSLIDFRAAASGAIDGNMTTIAFYVTAICAPTVPAEQ
jgi:hypothetical protein